MIVVQRDRLLCYSKPHCNSLTVFLTAILCTIVPLLRNDGVSLKGDGWLLRYAEPVFSVPRGDCGAIVLIRVASRGRPYFRNTAPILTLLRTE